MPPCRLTREEVRLMDERVARDAAWARSGLIPPDEYAWVDRGYAQCVAMCKRLDQEEALTDK